MTWDDLSKILATLAIGSPIIVLLCWLWKDYKEGK